MEKKKWFEGLEGRPTKTCSICKSKKTYKNPLTKCFECKKDFCYDHINSIQMNNKMKKEDELRDVCDECQKKHRYKTV